MAITTAYDGKRKDGELIRYPLAAGQKIPKGALVVLSAGLAANAADTAGVQFTGVAYETADNTGGAAGAVSVRVLKRGDYIYSKAAAVQADVGKQALVVDNGTVATAATTNSIPAGYVAELVDAGHVRVRIDRGVQ